ncbi:MAG: M20/M25/M40 family metallo-hydrolase [Spirochaetales bacterium]|nr:M20/M25/M40 family metallo-hydrolase [Spirochaetales bacterium]
MNLPRAIEKTKNHALASLFIVFVVGLAFVRLTLNGLPPVPAPAPGRPDLARLEAHVRALASEPHPIGSEAHERTRRYILAELEAAGVEPVEQNSSAIGPISPGLTRAGRVRNVIARVPGNPGTDAILLAAHYDSVPAGPGASDDASSVAGLLEAVRLLKAGARPRNDVVFLFSDAEEIGMVGAQAFADESPLMEKIRAVFNFEARGTTGPVLLFETGQDSADLVRAFLAADPHPQGTSLATTVYQYLPNNTDFTVFKDRGLPGLNFACIGDLPAYHTRLDNPNRLDPRTLMLQAEHAWTCARTFGNSYLMRPSGREEIVFFPALGTFHVSYSQAPALVLAAAAILLLGLAFFFGIRAGLISIGKIIAGGGAVLLLAAAAGGLA